MEDSRMKSHDLMRELLKRTSAKWIAAEMRLSLSLVYQWASEDTATHSPLARIEQLIRSTQDDRIGHWIASLLGGIFLPRYKPARRDPRDMMGARFAFVVTQVRIG